MLQGFQGLQPLLGQLCGPLVIEGFHPALRGVLHEHIKHIPVAVRVNKVSVVLDPADLPVLPPYAVLYEVQLLLAFRDLEPDALRYPLPVLRMAQPPEGVAGILLEILQIPAAVNPDQSLIGVNQPFLPIGVVDEEAAGHPGGNLLNNGEGLLAEHQRQDLLLFLFLHVQFRPFPQRYPTVRPAPPGY